MQANSEGSGQTEGQAAQMYRLLACPNLCGLHSEKKQLILSVQYHLAEIATKLPTDTIVQGIWMTVF